MHITALENAKIFVNTYFSCFNLSATVKVVEIGSFIVNDSIRKAFPKNVDYAGIDVSPGYGVDIVLTDPYVYPLESNSVDIIVSSSCFEHIEMFWLSFLEILRILKPSGLFYLHVPSSGKYHKHPLDCWRFYPDSGNALVSWANKNDIKTVMLESYIQVNENWKDFVSIFLKDVLYVEQYTRRILHTKKDFINGKLYGSDLILKYAKGK